MQNKMKKFIVLFISLICLYNLSFAQLINLDKNNFVFSAVQKGSLPLSQSFTISNGGSGTLNWNVSDDADWLDINPGNGTDSGFVIVNINTTNKNPGTYTATITVNASGAANSPQTITIAYTVLQRPLIGLNKSTITFNTIQNSVLPAYDSIKIINSGGGTFSWSIISNVTWLNINPTSGKDSGTIKVSVNTTNMNPGTYNATITLTSIEADNSPQVINVSYIVRPTYPSTLNLNRTINFPTYSSVSDYKSTDYKLIGLPGKSDVSVKDFLSGTQGIDWQAFWDNGMENNYFLEFDGSSSFLFTTGRAFWILKKSQMVVNTTAASTPLNSQYQVEIPLHSGWNIITNPFLSSVYWSKIQSVNNTNTPIWKYSGKFETSSNFDPYEGYYFDNQDKLSTLKIPYGDFSSASLNVNEEDNGTWNMKIVLSSKEDIYGYISPGVSPDARKEIDKYDFRKPRSLSNDFVPSIYFDRSNWGNEYKYIAADIRPYFEETECWDFVIENVGRNTVLSLMFIGIKTITSIFEVYLFDISKGIYTDIRKDSIYYFTNLNKTSRFSVLIGKNNAVKEKINSIESPKDFSINQNYPNPFNSTTNVSITIPRTAEIKLSIFDILGKEVNTIYSGILSKGYYSFEWNGKDNHGFMQTSGMYICRLVTNSGINLSRKIILLK
jgi:hypothetical protein